MYASLLTVLIVCLCGIYAQVTHIQCPRCTDPYNPESCTERHTCLAISSCSHLAAQGCDSTKTTCYYCCSNYNECLQELKPIIAATHTTHIPATTRTTTSSHVTHQDLTTTEQSPSSTYGVTTSEYVTTSYDVTTTSDDVTTSDEITTSDDVTTTSDVVRTTSVNTYKTTDFIDDTTEAADSATTATEKILTSVPVEFLTSLTPEFSDLSTTVQTLTSCVQCGDFAYDKPCTQIELVLNDASVCPEGLPYCFETVNLSGGNLQVMRGCAEANFCRVEWDFGHLRLGCYPLDVRAANVSCTYCCSGDSCNISTPPPEEKQVTFP